MFWRRNDRYYDASYYDDEPARFSLPWGRGAPWGRRDEYDYVPISRGIPWKGLLFVVAAASGAAGYLLNKKKAKASLPALPKHYKDEKTALGALAKNFPGALPLQLCVDVVTSTLKSEGMNGKNTLLACSLCRDELNITKEGDDLAKILASKWGEMHHLAGHAGIPFAAGKSTWASMVHRLQPDGHVLLVFAPHVGIDKAGNVGFLTSEDTDESVPCCAAALTAMEAGAARAKGGVGGPYDMERTYLQQLLAAKYPNLGRYENPLLPLAYAMYEIIRDHMRQVVVPKAGQGKIAVLGGLQLNITGAEDHFLPLSFELYDPASQAIVNAVAALTTDIDAGIGKPDTTDYSLFPLPTPQSGVSVMGARAGVRSSTGGWGNSTYAAQRAAASSPMSAGVRGVRKSGWGV